MTNYTQENPYLTAPVRSTARLRCALSRLGLNGSVPEVDGVEWAPLTICLNKQEIVTAMRIGDYPEYLAEAAVGFDTPPSPVPGLNISYVPAIADFTTMQTGLGA